MIDENVTAFVLSFWRDRFPTHCRVPKPFITACSAAPQFFADEFKFGTDEGTEIS
jgi:hypothetical protein